MPALDKIARLLLPPVESVPPVWFALPGGGVLEYKDTGFSIRINLNARAVGEVLSAHDPEGRCIANCGESRLPELQEFVAQIANRRALFFLPKKGPQ